MRAKRDKCRGPNSVGAESWCQQRHKLAQDGASRICLARCTGRGRGALFSAFGAKCDAVSTAPHAPPWARREAPGRGSRAAQGASMPACKHPTTWKHQVQHVQRSQQHRKISQVGIEDPRLSATSPGTSRNER